MTNEQAKELKRGDEVWYTNSDGECHEASVLSADGDHVIIRYIARHGGVIVRCLPEEISHE